MQDKVIYMLTTVFYPSIGGRESHIHNISKELVKLGYIVKIINPVINLTKTSIEVFDGIEVHRLSIGDSNSEKKYLKYKNKSKGLAGYLSGYLRKNFYNKFYKDIYGYVENDMSKNNYNRKSIIIHQHDFISGYKLSKEFSKSYKVIFTNHTGEFLFLKKLPFNKMIITHLTKHFKYIISPSKELNQFNGIRGKRSFSYIPNGVDLEEFYVADESQIKNLKLEYGLDENKHMILCPRRWAPTKGIIYLIKAINILKDTDVGDKFQAVFIGNDYEDYPEYKSEILNFIKENNLGKYIKLLGNIEYENMSKITQASDIIVIPSLMEAVSLSMLESMSCGKIVVGSNTGGIPEVIKNNKNGFLVKKADEISLADKLYDIIKRYDELEYIRIKARESVEKLYSWKRITHEVEKIYVNVLNGKY
ncbi:MULTISPECIES: glycosyltransferase family 4 protein [unclassified Clostridium]|uniref:glycosyltransferase family 4 protein n=1 Tax=unclassified Clostridium TaxID=2614128 RepID=UPI00207A798C|nr:MULTISPECIES: glycosyltransferase family 4 protein [unclassified Clostridium]